MIIHFTSLRAAARSLAAPIASLLAVCFASASAAVPPPPTQITAPGGRAFRLYDNVLMAQAISGGLRERGFNNAFTWDRPLMPNHSFFMDHEPAALQDGGPEEADFRAQVHEVCALSVHPTEITLVIIDFEWDSLSLVATAPTTAIPYDHFVVNDAALAKAVTLLRWMRTEFATTPCAARVRLGFYASVPTAWVSFFGTEDPRARDSRHQAMRKMASAMAPFLDFHSPSLYPPYASSANPNLGMTHDAFWVRAASDTLEVSKALADEAGIALLPYVGLRYYGAGGGPSLNHYIERTFFTTMLATITNPAYGCEGAIYWDWGPYGGPGYANDGSNVWSYQAPWYVATFDFFSAPRGTFPMVPLLIKDLIIRN